MQNSVKKNYREVFYIYIYKKDVKAEAPVWAANLPGASVVVDIFLAEIL